MADRVSAPEALIYAMVTVSAADRAISAEEISRIGSIVRELPAFRSYGDDWLTGAAQACGKLLRKPEGVEKVVAIIAASLHGPLRETAYVLAAEVAASDLVANADEVAFLALLRDKLELDALTVAALERAARVRNQRA